MIFKSFLITLFIVVIFSFINFALMLIKVDVSFLVHYIEIVDIIALVITYGIVILYLNVTTIKLPRIKKEFPLKIEILFILLVMIIAEKLMDRPFFDYKKLSNLILNTNYVIFDVSQHEFNMIRLYQGVSAILITPVVEEIVFRYYIFGQLIKRNTFIVALLTSSIAFSLIHIGSPRNLIPTLLFGIISGLIYYKTNKIIYSIIFHALANSIWFLMIVFAKEYYELYEKIGLGFTYWAIFFLGIIICIFFVKKIKQNDIMHNFKKKQLHRMNDKL